MSKLFQPHCTASPSQNNLFWFIFHGECYGPVRVQSLDSNSRRPNSQVWDESVDGVWTENEPCPIFRPTHWFPDLSFPDFWTSCSVLSGIHFLSWPTTCSKNQSNEWHVWRKYFCSFINQNFFNRKNSSQSNCWYRRHSFDWRSPIKNLENIKNENNWPKFIEIQFWKFEKLKNIFFEMARKWLDIGVIGHKWTVDEYKKG